MGSPEEPGDTGERSEMEGIGLVSRLLIRFSSESFLILKSFISVDFNKRLFLRFCNSEIIISPSAASEPKANLGLRGVLGDIAFSLLISMSNSSFTVERDAMVLSL